MNQTWASSIMSTSQCHDDDDDDEDDDDDGAQWYKTALPLDYLVLATLWWCELLHFNGKIEILSLVHSNLKVDWFVLNQ